MFFSNHVSTTDSIIDRCRNMGSTPQRTINVLDAMFPYKTFAERDLDARLERVLGYRAKLAELRRLPVVAQKSPEWHAIRQNLITASDFAQALGEGKFGTQKQLYQKKCGYDEAAPFNGDLPPLKWGNMFEFVAQTIYAQRNHTVVHEFGILQHPSVPHFGASPDGITDDGVMLEIKCPWRRKINGEIPKQYYYQIQGQLDVCDLEECDYFECEFEETLSGLPEGFELERGAIVEHPHGIYRYSDVRTDWTPEAIKAWVDEALADAVLKDGGNSSGNSSPDSYRGPKVHYYALKCCLTLRVYRDPAFLTEKLDQLQDVWDKIREYRSDELLYKAEIEKTTRRRVAAAANVESAGKAGSVWGGGSSGSSGSSGRGGRNTLRITECLL